MVMQSQLISEADRNIEVANLGIVTHSLQGHASE